MTKQLYKLMRDMDVFEKTKDEDPAENITLFRKIGK